MKKEIRCIADVLDADAIKLNKDLVSWENRFGGAWRTTEIPILGKLCTISTNLDTTASYCPKALVRAVLVSFAKNCDIFYRERFFEVESISKRISIQAASNLYLALQTRMLEKVDFYK